MPDPYNPADACVGALRRNKTHLSIKTARNQTTDHFIFMKWLDRRCVCCTYGHQVDIVVSSDG